MAFHLVTIINTSRWASWNEWQLGGRLVCVRFMNDSWAWLSLNPHFHIFRLWWKPFQHLLQSIESAQWQSLHINRQGNYSLASVKFPLRPPCPVFLRSSSAKTCSKMSRLIIMHLLNLEHAPTAKSELIYLLKESISPWQKFVRWPDARLSNGWHLLGRVFMCLLPIGLIFMLFVCAFIESPAMGTVFIRFSFNQYCFLPLGGRP